MGLVIARRIMAAIPALFGVSVVIFILLNVLPGDPLAGLLAPDATPEDRQELAAALGLDDPLPVQFANWLGGIMQGDLGYSFARQRPVNELISAAFINTLILASAAAVIGLSMGVFLGTVAALFPGRWPDRAISLLAVTGLSVPSYWLAILLIIIFSVQLRWLPATGMRGLEEGLVTFLRYLIMPALATSMITIGLTARMTRTSLIEQFGEDYVLMLRAKGLSDSRILLHVIKNAAPQVLTVAGLQVGYLLGGSVLVETIFAWPGLGQLIFQSIAARDLQVIQASVLVIAVTFVLVNLVVDLLQATINPRLRRAS